MCVDAGHRDFEGGYVWRVCRVKKGVHVTTPHRVRTRTRARVRVRTLLTGVCVCHDVHALCMHEYVYDHVHLSGGGRPNEGDVGALGYGGRRSHRASNHGIDICASCVWYLLEKAFAQKHRRSQRSS